MFYNRGSLLNAFIVYFMPANSDELTNAILHQIAAVPEGKVSTYGAIAKAVGYPSHSRFVGRVLKNLPSGSKVPWHRILNSQGKSSFPPGSAAYKEQKKRLQEEGVPFLNNRVNLRQFSVFY